MKKDGFTVCANNYVSCLRREGRYATAHVYQNALRSFTVFCGTKTVSFNQITRENLKRYGNYLAASQLRLNTISTYMRMLRSIYNRGVDDGQAPYIYRLFHDVFTGVDSRQKKAIPVHELHTLLYEDPGVDKLRHTQDIAKLLFLFCGMSFSDLAHLKKADLKDGILKYNRIKTGTPMSMEILDSAVNIMSRLLNNDRSVDSSDYPDYLFKILSGRHRLKEEGAYIEYQSALRRFNNQLKSLARHFRLHSSVTSYSFRHSWATTAKYRGVPIEMISESLGHKSIKTTQIYLKSFDLAERTKVNRMNYFYVRNYKKKLSI
ncbi:site-specific integrase [uncultured Bacteroides sp.]|uniref:tyrosine-type recombinase/integrase n=1 Tax=uncultured Bacteroides sp. TaxID=162156 RepID=UPI002674B768|nr:site-specific integrase [uncultured Bacteroides sp.]